MAGPQLTHLAFANGIEELTRRLVNRARKVKLVAAFAALGTNDEDLLLNAVVELQANRVADTRRILIRDLTAKVGLRRNDLNFIDQLRENLLTKEIALVVLKVDVVRLNRAVQVRIRQRAQRELARIQTRLELLVRNVIGTDTNLAVRRINNCIKTAAEINLKNDGVETEGSDGQCKL